MKSKYMAVIPFLFAFGILLISGCSVTTQKSTSSQENMPEIIIGSDDFPPFNYSDENGEPAGIDVDIANEALGRLGYKPVFTKIVWDDKDKDLENKEIDCLWGCFSMDGRENDYKWAGPYMVSRQVVAVNENSTIKKLSDLSGKVIAVQASTKPEDIFLNRTNPSIPLVKDVYSLENRKLLFTSLGKCYVDAIAAHETSIQQYIKDYGAKIRILDEAILTTGIGVAFPENTDSELPEKLTEIFKEMRKDGSEEKILKKYLPETSGYLEVDKIENN